MPRSPMGEVCVARALVPNRCNAVQVRVMNLASYPVTLTARAVLAELEPVFAMDEFEPESETPRGAVSMKSDDRVELPEYAGELRARVDPAVSRASRRTMIEFLLRYPTAFFAGGE